MLFRSDRVARAVDEDLRVADLLCTRPVGDLREGEQQTITVPPCPLERQRTDVGFRRESSARHEPGVRVVRADLDRDLSADAVRLAQTGDDLAHAPPGF